MKFVVVDISLNSSLEGRRMAGMVRHNGIECVNAEIKLKDRLFGVERLFEMRLKGTI